MKRAKLLLTIIVVLAVVSGALAFKANQRFTKSFCVLTTDGAPLGGGTCKNEIENSKYFAAGGTNQITYYYTLKNVGDNCSMKNCTSSTSFITD